MDNPHIFYIRVNLAHIKLQRGEDIMTKRAISLILAFALILGSFNFVSAGSDIDGHWASREIQYLLNQGIVICRY